MGSCSSWPIQVNGREMTFTPDGILLVIASQHIAADLPNLEPGTMRALAWLHERRGERLSAMQWREQAKRKEREDAETSA